MKRTGRGAGLVALLWCCGSGLAADAPGLATPARACRAPLGASPAERLHAHLKHEEAAGFSGAVLVADNDAVVFQGEYGTAAGDAGSTAFWIASISKAIAATAALELAEQGRLDLRAPLGAYLADVPPAWRAVTAHHLLSHRSGFGHLYGTDGIVDRDTATRALLAQAPVKKIGEFEYSNDGYNLLAILIEKAAGTSFEDHVRRAVFVPAKMEGAGFWGFEPPSSPLAGLSDPSKASAMRATIWSDGRSVANWGYRGATGIYATPMDLFRFARAIGGGRVLEPATFAAMIASKSPAPKPDAQTYGYGMALLFKGGRLTEYWHGGNEDWLGHNGLLKVIGDRTYVVLSNSGDFAGRGWSHRIEEGLRACADGL